MSMFRLALPLVLPALVFAQSPTTTVSFPALAGWEKKEAPKRFGPNELFEHINGAADGFLEFNFQELTVQNYEDKDQKWVTVEVYRHDSPLSAFGVYSQEKPVPGNYLPVGAQGYYDDGGVLNFIKGSTYVKLNASGLGSRTREVLLRFAEAMVKVLEGESRLPELLGAFPAQDRVPQSERFTLNNVLGYASLRSGFSCEYKVGDQAYRVWILAGDARLLGSMLAKYCEAQGLKEVPRTGAQVVVQDKFNGPLTLRILPDRVFMVQGGQAPGQAVLLERFPKAGK